MKFGKIFDYRNRDEAEIGKEYVFSDFCKSVFNEEIAETKPHLKLKAVRDGRCPFETEVGTPFQFIREVIDEPVLMTYRQLAEWLAKGNGLALDKDGDVATSCFMCPIPIENKQLSDVLLIRPWDSDEWVVPTVDIYERDCR